MYRHFGDSYKWLLYGDDDTFFFLDAAMEVLQHLDPDMPYFLTGSEHSRIPHCRSILFPTSFSTVSASFGSMQDAALCMCGFRGGQVLPLLARTLHLVPKFGNDALAGMLNVAMTSHEVLPFAGCAPVPRLTVDWEFLLDVPDHMWWTSREFDDISGQERSDTHHPHAAAPLCVPCNYARNTSELPFPQPNGCPCTPELLCAADTRGAHSTAICLLSSMSDTWLCLIGIWRFVHEILHPEQFSALSGDKVTFSVS